MCGDPGVPENGFRTPSGGVFFENAVARFHCQDGFRLKGSTKRLCMRYFNGTLGWVPSDKTVCIQEGKGPAPLRSQGCARRAGMRAGCSGGVCPRAGLVYKTSLHGALPLSVTIVAIQFITILTGATEHSGYTRPFDIRLPAQHCLPWSSVERQEIFFLCRSW